jgi:hypothetical protein
MMLSATSHRGKRKAPRKWQTEGVFVRAVVVVTIVAGGCGFRADFDGTGYRCGTGDRCPPDYMCVDGYCVASIPFDASVVDAGPIAGACGSISNLRDDFSNDAIDPLWSPFSDSGATVTESGGQTRVALTAGTGSPYAGITSAALYDLRDGAIDVSVAQLGGGVTILEVRDFDGQRAQLVADATSITAAVYDTPDKGERNTIPYVAAEHRYWRIRADADGTMYWELSGNRTTWTELHREDTVLDVANVFGIVSAGEQLAVASTALFDDVNPDPAAGLCAAASFTEDFAASPLDPTWEHWEETGCTVTEAAGDLRMDFAGTTNCFTGVATRHLYDLRDSEFVVDTATPTATNFISYMQVLPLGDADTHLEIGHDGGMYFEQSVANVNTDETTAAFDAADQRYWRIRGYGGRVSIDTSPDGSTWDNHIDAPAGFDLSAVQLVLGAGNYGAVGSAVAVTWAGVNQ